MDDDKKLEFLNHEVSDQIRRMVRKRTQDKILAFGCKIVTVSFGATVAVLLGLKVDATLTELFRNIALVLGGTITVVNAFDLFFNFRYLWVKRTAMLMRLIALKRDIAFYTLSPEQGDSHIHILDEFILRLNRILEDELNDWLKLREEEQSQHISQALENK